MLGYVVPHKGELKIREYEIYRSYYCGICKSVGRRYGQLPRLVLSYDFAFLALLLAALEPESESLKREHCLVHPVQKKPVTEENHAIRYGGDVMLILAYYKLMDDYLDDNSYKARAAALGLEPTIRRIRKEKEGLCQLTETNLQALAQLEKANCPELDRVEEPFAQIMKAIFQQGALETGGTVDVANLEKRQKLLGHIGYHLGKWIYLMDAYEDIDENIAKKTYNPLLYRFDYDSDKESISSFRERIRDEVEFNLIHYLAELSNGLDLLDIKKNRGILENIAYLGLRRRTEQVLAGEKPSEPDSPSVHEEQ
ncbi:hypothetical protein Ami103574_03685 [Aminipila butyrica]|uniref:Uncharacterized protein n=1 Tax=Aminipila butyrica TaxID=433296 RepID=A0A858BRG1_9FIRM|nr:DUF5685 family protein [Aminipila butyrica]QIB68473.1 hypothetical protein Ami103574_03685 [Aminipila butyrica]